MSEFYAGSQDEAAHVKTLHAALEPGVQYFDTADMYGAGQNVALLGKAFANRRAAATIATKILVRPGPTERATNHSLRRFAGHPDCGRAGLREARPREDWDLIGFSIKFAPSTSGAPLVAASRHAGLAAPLPEQAGRLGIEELVVGHLPARRLVGATLRRDEERAANPVHVLVAHRSHRFSALVVGTEDLEPTRSFRPAWLRSAVP